MIRKRYSFLYLPEGDGRTRELHVPRAVLVGALAVLAVLVTASGLYVVDWVTGSAWRPGGAPVARENVVLRQQVATFETRVADMQQDLDEVFAYQQAVAAAVDITPLDAETRLAGVGGRGPLTTPDELLGLEVAPQLDQLLRQSRIQRAGMAALLDSLSSRDDARDRIPSIRPCDIGWLSSRYGKRRDPFTGRQAFHRGLDFSLPVGTPVRVTASGRVVVVEKQRGLGRLVKVDHGNGLMTVYAHLQEALVEEGQEVARGEVIARSGNSGRSTAPHLHYEVRVAGRSVNPLTYILDTYASRS
ncbi:peptidoglycan DD-metalloendopeptidase family protein [bacterium]|nr:peptidoglycan DD-metalloendopeptidase family protein [bacterium]